VKVSGFIIFLFLSATVSFGQPELAIKADINTSTAIYQNHPLPYKMGYDAGVSVDWTLRKKMFLSTQVQYSQKGNKINNGDVTIGYLSIPVLCGYRLTKRYSVLIGIESGILLHAQIISSGISVNNTQQYKPVDFSLNAGMRYMILPKVGIYFSYVLSLDGIYKSSWKVPVYNPVNGYSSYMIYSITPDQNIRSQTFQLGIYWSAFL
jgi:opacity protein-like surface antigen